ncbi:MAG TPA: tRNA pseudouridine(55) synthase TruB [Gemmatimonadaceae bacterium]|jgi:tRNA pseudouridine55 synthase|nr:tRNA pseudouridine(55) synthase TruB [Gemmatimonadaceae bacterium]
METRTTDVAGLALVDKPAGMTSHDVVAVVRRATGAKRAGHAGTLDPFATGLLVVLLGRATRLIPHIQGEPKVYDATIRFGEETDTDDATGIAVRRADVPDDSAIARGVEHLTGDIAQMPPAYSAKSVDGVRAYAAARRGAPLELAPVRVVVHEWQLGALSGNDLNARITCGGGTYVRALARDLGRATGSAAHLVALRRVRSGAFSVEDAHSLDEYGDHAAALRPPLDAVSHLPVQQLTETELARVAHGNPVAVRTGGRTVSLVDETGALVAIAERHDDTLQPKTVIRDAG